MKITEAEIFYLMVTLLDTLKVEDQNIFTIEKQARENIYTNILMRNDFVHKETLKRNADGTYPHL